MGDTGSVGVRIDHTNDQLKMASIMPIPTDEQERLQFAKERLQAEQERLARYRSGQPVWGFPKVFLKNVDMIKKEKKEALGWVRRKAIEISSKVSNYKVCDRHAMPKVHVPALFKDTEARVFQKISEEIQVFGGCQMSDAAKGVSEISFWHVCFAG
jgi:hypothetical protein